MSGGEFDAELKNAIRALRSEVDSLAKAQKGANEEVRRYAKEARDAFGNVPKPPTTHVENFGRSVKELGHALGRLGGPLGELAHRLGGGAGMEGQLGRVAVAAGVVSFAMGALNAVTEKQTEDVKKAAEAEETYFKALEKGRSVQKQQAEAGLGQAKNRRDLLAAGGEEAVGAADSISERLAGIVTSDQAERGAAAAYGKYGKTGRARGTLLLAEDLARVGVGFDEAVQALLKAGGNVNDPATGHAIAARVFQQKRGGIGDAGAQFDAALAGVQGDPLLQAAQDAGVSRNQIHLIERDRGIENGANAARDDLARAKDPIGVAISEVQQAADRQIKILEDAAKQQGVVSRAIANLDLLRGGPGSLANQAERQKRINAGASLDAGQPLNPER